MVVGLHGFTRSPVHLQRLAHRCAGSGLACLRPRLAPTLDPVRIARPRSIEQLASGLADALEGFDRPIVILGHSAGAAAACWIARTWLKDSRSLALAGLVLVDGVDSVSGLIARSLEDLRHVPMAALVADPGPGNRNGALARFLDAQRPGVTVRLEGSSHGDIEGEDRLVYRLACRDHSSDRMRRRVVDTAVQAALRLVACSGPEAGVSRSRSASPGAPAAAPRSSARSTSLGAR